MIQKLIARILLAPFAFIYGILMALRNTFYDTEILKSSEFNLPVISVGNLTIGGSGKTPHVEYLTRLLKPFLNVSILSRGYKRKTKGFAIVKDMRNPMMYGDEPSLFKLKYPDVVVAVSESRAVGIPMILQKHPSVNTVILDDAFQHRSVRPSLNILLTEYSLPFTQDYILPAGRLREPKSAYKRADIIIVTKCPDFISEEEKNQLIEEIKPYKHQKIYFSKYKYQQPYYLLNPKYRVDLEKRYEVILLSAIANTEYLEGYLASQVHDVHAVNYEDHHYFTEFDMSQLKRMFDNLEVENKFILTSEKDAVRLFEHRQFIIDNKLPIYVLPIQVELMFEEGRAFDQLIKDYLLNFKV